MQSPHKEHKKSSNKTLQRIEADASYCKGEASILGDIPVPGKDRRSTASTGGHAWPPEVPFLLRGSKGIGYIVLCQLLENLRGTREESTLLKQGGCSLKAQCRHWH